jgi:hypothetical protein
MTRFLLDTGSAGDYIHRRGVYERARQTVAAANGRASACVLALLAAVVVVPGKTRL